MLSTASEKKFHVIRWILFLAWALLIVSLFYDPVSAALTHPDHAWSPWADRFIAIAHSSTQCVHVQTRCIPLEPYPIGTRLFWGTVVPSAIFIVLVFGHQVWRRICPLYFFSQLPRALGMKPLLNIEHNQWLQTYHFDIQFVLFFFGITGRILFFNAMRPVVGVFFILTLLFAAGVVTLYGGRSWCHYVCPFGMVQTVFTGPGGLLDSPAHTAEPFTLTQSTCRTVDDQGQEQSACISCKSACMDIDAEQSYWEQLYKPGRRLVQYGYLGLVVGYFCYYGLYAGNFEYYFSGVWSHEARSLSALADPGFYLFGQTIDIPKLVAAPLTLAAFAAASCWLCTRLERYYRGYLKQKNADVPAEESLHKIFSLCTFLAFNLFFIYGGRPEINHLPLMAQFGFQATIGIVSSLWLYRTWGRTRSQYKQESLASKRRRQLKKLSVNIDALLSNSGEARTIDRLTAEELSILAQTLPQLDAMPDVAPVPNPVSQTKPAVRQGLPKTAFSRKPTKKTPLPRTQIRKR